MDFVTVRQDYPNPEGGRNLIEFTLTIKAAKQVARLQVAKRGMGVVGYLSEYEQRSAQGLNQQTAIELLTASPDTQPKPAGKPVATQPAQALTPIQQLLQQAQQLAEAEAEKENKAG